MSLLKPFLNIVPAFDATQQNIFTFTVPSGSDQVTQNRLTITNQSTGVIVYQQTQTTFAFTHTLSANTLTNGTYYSAYINTFNANGDMSVNSNIVQFYCYTAPTYAFTNLPLNNIITNSSFNFEVTYNQIEGELLNSYEFLLYDAQNIEIANSGIKYVGSSTPPPTVISYTFSGLADNTSYYIKSIGSTINGTAVSTSSTQITVQYTQTNVFAIVQLSQNCDGGYVTVQSNLIDIEGKSQPSPPIYIGNTEVDVTGNGNYILWDNGYELNNDFTLQIWGRDFNSNAPIMTMENQNGDILTLRYCEGYYQGGATLQAYLDLTIQSGSLFYYIYSNYIDIPTSTQKVQVWLRRINNMYQLDIYNLG